MRELTHELPKPMLQVRGKPVLQHIIEGLRDAGLTDFLIIVGWHAEVVRDFFAEGRNLHRLGLAGLRPDEILSKLSH